MASNSASAHESDSDSEPALQPLSNPPASHRLLTQKYDSFEALYSELEGFATAAGFGVYKIRSSNYINKMPTRVNLACKRGSIRLSKAQLRVTSTTKMDCLW